MFPRLLFISIHATLFLVLLTCQPMLAEESPSVASSELQSKETPNAILTIRDCQKCHSNVVNTINIHGNAHKTKVTCINCHEGHPPAKRNIIPLCSKCHKDSPHFKLNECFLCHTNPHSPLRIRLSKNITVPCTTCHASQISQLKNYPSIHTTLHCTACHTHHGYVPECFVCHAPHLDGMQQQDCISCHQAHKPLIVSYDPEVPSEFCGSCHQNAYQLLGKSHAKHRRIPCVQCHEQKHKTIPLCAKCHKQPHPAQIIDKFAGCANCHGVAHDLQLNKIDLKIETENKNPR